MKKAFLELFIILLIAFLVGCQAVGDHISPITNEADAIEAMKKAYCEQSEKDIQPWEVQVDFYGSYGDNHVGFFFGSGNGLQVIRTYDFMGLEFIFSSSQMLFVYNNGQLLPLDQAVEKGWFQQEEIAALHTYYKTMKGYLYPPMTQEEAEQAMKEAYVRLHPQVDIHQLSVRYYGQYDSCYVGFIDGGEEFRAGIHRETVDGLEFVYESSQTLVVYRDGRLMPLNEAKLYGLLGYYLHRLHDLYKSKYPHLYENP